MPPFPSESFSPPLPEGTKTYTMLMTIITNASPEEIALLFQKGDFIVEGKRVLVTGLDIDTAK